ncbi:hypothetical protein ACQKWADRAFT_301978 [Trichoderma austrokoningii]
MLNSETSQNSAKMPAVATRSQLDENAEDDKKFGPSRGLSFIHGVEDALYTTLTFENNGITCCCVGVSALKLYGCSRMRDVWEICVPNALYFKAIQTLQLPPFSDEYISTDPICRLQSQSLLHTYDHFRKQGSTYAFTIMPCSIASGFFSAKLLDTSSSTYCDR